jgi:hypothetical protein
VADYENVAWLQPPNSSAIDPQVRDVSTQSADTALFGDDSSSLRQHVHPFVDALHSIDTHSNIWNAQKPGALRHSRSTPSQSIHELDSYSANQLRAGQSPFAKKAI